MLTPNNKWKLYNVMSLPDRYLMGTLVHEMMKGNGMVWLARFSVGWVHFVVFIARSAVFKAVCLHCNPNLLKWMLFKWAFLFCHQVKATFFLYISECYNGCIITEYQFAQRGGNWLYQTILHPDTSMPLLKRRSKNPTISSSCSHSAKR